MPLEFVVKALDQVEESIRGAYEERDGEFHFDPDKYAEIKAQGLKNKNRELLTDIEKAKPLRARGEKFKDVTDQDWDDYQSWKQSKDAGDGDGDGGGNAGKGKSGQVDLEKAIANEKRRFERDLTAVKSEIAQKDQEIASLNGRIREFSIWTPVRDMAVAAKVLPDRLDAFVTLLKSQGRFDLDESNKLIFKDKEGYPTTVTPEGAFKTELKNEFAWAFQASESGGSGASRSSGGKLGADLSKMGAQERMKYAREHGLKE